jgi:hypothetical protein
MRAVLGDGFAAADQAAYNAKVQDLLLDGVFARDYFCDKLAKPVADQVKKAFR